MCSSEFLSLQLKHNRKERNSTPSPHLIPSCCLPFLNQSNINLIDNQSFMAFSPSTRLKLGSLLPCIFRARSFFFLDFNGTGHHLPTITARLPAVILICSPGNCHYLAHCLPLPKTSISSPLQDSRSISTSLTPRHTPSILTSFTSRSPKFKKIPPTSVRSPFFPSSKNRLLILSQCWGAEGIF